MKISAKTEYACIAMLELAMSYPTGEPVRIRKIADDHGIPQRFLVQILLQLKGAGWVSSTRGAAGGYQLARRPEDVTLLDVISTIEGPPEAPTAASGNPSSPPVEALTSIWRELFELQVAKLSEITLADLADRARGIPNNMYYI